MFVDNLPENKYDMESVLKITSHIVILYICLTI